MHDNPTILGVYFGHNASVAVAREGRVVFAMAEERTRRLKNYTGFPDQTYALALEHYLGGSPEAVDLVVFPSNTNLEYAYFLDGDSFPGGRYHGYHKDVYSNAIPDFFLNNDSAAIRRMVAEDIANCEAINADSEIRERALSYYEERLGIGRDRFEFLGHHEAHARSAMHCLPESEDWLILTLDSSGDNICATVNVSRDGELRTQQNTLRHPSLGTFYREVTAFLGFKPDEHEFKVMGLAPYAKARYCDDLFKKFSTLVRVNDDLAFESDFPMEMTRYFLLKHCVYERFDNIAGAAQHFLEERVLEWTLSWIRRTGINRVALAGGVFMNVKLNQRIGELPEVEKLHVVPSASDESTVFGCLDYGLRKLSASPLEPLENLYLGQAYCNEEIKRAIYGVLSRKGFEAEYVHDPEDLAAKLLEEQHIVARFADRSEWGARALGNRSLLADARNYNAVHTLNGIIKSRDFWMPFAPSILAEDAERYLMNPKGLRAPSMALTFQSAPLAREHLRAALHPQDHTMRPQIVAKHDNPRYHRLLSLFKARTGVGGVLNTSLNLHGEPNVLKPEDALHVFFNSGLEHLIMENWWVYKIGERG